MITNGIKQYICRYGITLLASTTTSISGKSAGMQAERMLEIEPNSETKNDSVTGVKKLTRVRARVGIFTKTSVLAIASLLVLGIAGVAPVTATAISYGFISGEGLSNGALVSINRTDPNEVILTNLNNSEYLVGVVAETRDSLVALRNVGSNVQVATSGQVFTLVTNVDGDIAIGDKLVPSRISGVAAKMPSSYYGKVLGVAKADFNAGSTSQIAQTVGEDIRIGKITVELILDDTAGGGVIKSGTTFLVGLGSNIAGREVTALQVVSSLGLFLIALGVGTVLLLNSSKTSFISLGRNPLSSPSITSNLLHVTTVSVAILIMGMVASYGVLLL